MVVMAVINTSCVAAETWPNKEVPGVPYWKLLPNEICTEDPENGTVCVKKPSAVSDYVKVEEFEMEKGDKLKWKIKMNMNDKLCNDIGSSSTATDFREIADEYLEDKEKWIELAMMDVYPVKTKTDTVFIDMTDCEEEIEVELEKWETGIPLWIGWGTQSWVTSEQCTINTTRNTTDVTYANCDVDITDDATLYVEHDFYCNVTGQNEFRVNVTANGTLWIGGVEWDNNGVDGLDCRTYIYGELISNGTSFHDDAELWWYGNANGTISNYYTETNRRDNFYGNTHVTIRNSLDGDTRGPRVHITGDETFEVYGAGGGGTPRDFYYRSYDGGMNITFYDVSTYYIYVDTKSDRTGTTLINSSHLEAYSDMKGRVVFNQSWANGYASWYGEIEAIEGSEAEQSWSYPVFNDNVNVTLSGHYEFGSTIRAEDNTMLNSTCGEDDYTIAGNTGTYRIAPGNPDNPPITTGCWDFFSDARYVLKTSTARRIFPVYTFDESDGTTPVSGQNITMRNESGAIMTSCLTDVNGYCEIDHTFTAIDIGCNGTSHASYGCYPGIESKIFNFTIEVEGSFEENITFWEDNYPNGFEYNVSTEEEEESNNTISNCTSITEAGYYNMSNSISNSAVDKCINITASDVVLDCEGHTIDGVDSDDTMGIYSNSNDNITIRDCIVSDWKYNINLEDGTGMNISNYTGTSAYYDEIYLDNVTDSYIEDNHFYDGDYDPMLLAFCDNITVRRNLIEDYTTPSNINGIYMYDTNNSHIYGNVIDNLDQSSITLHTQSQGNLIENNTIINCKIGMDIESTSNENIITNNTISCDVYAVSITSSASQLIYNNVINATYYTNFAGTLYGNTWNVTEQPGERIITDGPNIGGNYYTNSTGTGYSDTCTDADTDGFCDTELNHSSGNVDWLPLSDEYGECESSWVNTSWNYMGNYSINNTLFDCEINDEQLNWTVWADWNYTTEYDENDCSGTNITYTYYINNTYQSNVTLPCDYCQYNVTNSSVTYEGNTTCNISDKFTEWSWWTEYDSNASTCYGITELPSDLWNGGDNITWYDNTTWDCDYCEYSIVNTTKNTTLEDCNISDQQLNWTWWEQYDENYTTCYGVTGLGSDLWNGGTNITWYDNETLPCDYCVPSLENTTWTYEGNTTPEATNGSCNMTNYLDYQMWNWTEWNWTVEWDTEMCGEVANYTHYINISWGNYTYNVPCTGGCVNNLENTTKNTTTEDCNISDQRLNWTWWVEWDTNMCGNFSNITWWDNETLSCDYCQYNVTNSSENYEGNTTCNISDYFTEWAWWIQYDSNASTCYGVTGIPTDQWNGGSNITWYDNDTWVCNYCSYNLTNTSITDEGNTTPTATNGSCNSTDVLDYQMWNWTHWTHWDTYDTNVTTCCGVTGLGSDCYSNVTTYDNTSYGNYTFNVACIYSAPCIGWFINFDRERGYTLSLNWIC